MVGQDLEAGKRGPLWVRAGEERAAVPSVGRRGMKEMVGWH